MMRYLCRSHDTDHLITPKDEKTFAKADQWIDWAHTTGWVPMRGLFWGMVRTPPEQRNPADIAASIEGCAKAFALVDQELSRHAYIAGDTFSFGDIPLALLAHRWFTIDIERPDMPHFQHWYEGIVARPGFAKHGSGPLS
jgi:glutathione S-transferase